MGVEGSPGSYRLLLASFLKLVLVLSEKLVPLVLALLLRAVDWMMVVAVVDVAFSRSSFTRLLTCQFLAGGQVAGRLMTEVQDISRTKCHEVSRV